MVSIPSGLTDSAPAVRRPTFDVSLGSASADEWTQNVVAIRSEAGLAPFTDVAHVFVYAGDDAPQVAVGDTGSLALGYEDDSEVTILTGTVDSVLRTTGGLTRVSVVNGGTSLCSLRVNQSYEDQNAGEVVTDLAGRSSADTEAIEDGVEFPFHVVDDRRNAYQHIASLAVTSGFIAYFTPDGGLMFAPYSDGQPVQAFSYGSEILSLSVSEAAPIVGAVTTIGESASGGEGAEAWSWLIKDPAPVTAESGDGDPARLITDSSLRSSDAAQGAADGLVGLMSMAAMTGTLAVPGAPAVVVGATIKISDAPSDALNGTCMVRRVRHNYDARRGFTTVIDFSKSGDGALGGLI